MSIENEDFNINAAFALLNKDVLDIYKSNYPQLSTINCSNNNLFYNEESFPLGYFRLNQVNAMVCELPAKDFYQVIKLLADVENNLAYEEAYIYNLNEIIIKTNINEQDKAIIIEFVEKYLKLKYYEDYLAGNSAMTLSKYRQIVNNILYLCDPNNLTEAQRYITEKVMLDSENIGGRGNSLTRTLKDPNTPNILPDEEAGFSKAGFASIILIIYTIINAAIILAISLIK